MEKVAQLEGNGEHSRWDRNSLRSWGEGGSVGGEW